MTSIYECNVQLLNHVENELKHAWKQVKISRLKHNTGEFSAGTSAGQEAGAGEKKHALAPSITKLVNGRC